MADTPLVKKLGIKPKYTILILNAPDGYNLVDLPEGATLKTKADGTFDLVQLFAKNKAELDANVQEAIRAMKPGGLLWITYPKQTRAIKSDLNRDRTWQAMQPTGLEPVTQIAIDDTWSAL